MPASPGAERGHNNAGGDPEALAAWVEQNYAALRERAERHAGADRRIPLDPLAALKAGDA